MELKVWVEGIPRVVCGVGADTTCQEVIVALAHAIGKTGRFTLVEKWRDTEHPLAPADTPVQSLSKWGEYAPDVQFVLRYSDNNMENVKNASRSGHRSNHRNFNGSNNNNVTKSSGSGDRLGSRPELLMRPKYATNIKRNLTFNGSYTGTPPRKQGGKASSSSHENSSLESLEEQSSFTSSTSSPYASMETRGQMESILGHHPHHNHRTLNGISSSGISESEEEPPPPLQPPQQQQQHLYSMQYSTSTKSTSSSRDSTPQDTTATTPVNSLERQLRPSSSSSSHKLSQTLNDSAGGRGERISSNSLSSTASSLSSSRNTAPWSLPSTASPKPNSVASNTDTQHGGVTPLPQSNKHITAYRIPTQTPPPPPPPRHSSTPQVIKSSHPSSSSSSSSSFTASIPPQTANTRNNINSGNASKREEEQGTTEVQGEKGQVYQERLVEVNRAELLRLVNLQLDRLHSQENQLQVLDTDICEREKTVSHHQQHVANGGEDNTTDDHLLPVAEEIKRLEVLDNDLRIHLDKLEHVGAEEKLALEKRRHREIVSALHAARAKLKACESELSDRREELSDVADHVHSASVDVTQHELDTKNAEIELEAEVGELRKQVEAKLAEYEVQESRVRQMLRESEWLQESLCEKTEEEDELERELREANMQEFSAATPGELLSESAGDDDETATIHGSTNALSINTRPGSARKIYYSPAALKEAISVSSNDATCWV